MKLFSELWPLSSHGIFFFLHQHCPGKFIALKPVKFENLNLEHPLLDPISTANRRQVVLSSPNRLIFFFGSNRNRINTALILFNS
jgi:hypothetical protein